MPSIRELKPPVGNAQVWKDGEMMVTVVGGPNNRRDFHDDPTEEFFYQLKGDIFLRLMETPGKPPIEVPIKEGEIFLLPKHMRHSPQRLLPGTIGVVVEMPRPEGALDGFEWYCQNCHQVVHCAEVFNDAALQLCSQGKGRLKSLCQVPLQDIDASCKELSRRCVPDTWEC